MKPQTLSTYIAIIIAVLSLTLLVPRLTFPQGSMVLLNATAIFTEDESQAQYSLTLNKGDQLQIQVQGNSQLVDLTIAQQSSPSQTLIYESPLFLEYSFEWTVPENGIYVFTLIAESATNAAITVTKV